MNVAIVGSRTFTDAKLVSHIVRWWANKHPGTLTIVSGGAAGADTLAANAALEQKVALQIFTADWAQFGKKAGFIRNNQIVEAADVVVALFSPGQRTPGTSHTVRTALAASKHVHVYQDGVWSKR